MFLNENYILANELVQKMGIHIANISVYRKRFEDENDLGTIKKMGDCNFINKASEKLPLTIMNGVRAHEFTDMTDKLSAPFVKTEWDLSYNELYDAGVITEQKFICGKRFYVFDHDFIKKVKRKICYVLNEKETKECFDKELIDGYIKISKKKYLTWYSLRK